MTDKLLISCSSALNYSLMFISVPNIDYYSDLQWVESVSHILNPYLRVILLFTKFALNFSDKCLLTTNVSEIRFKKYEIQIQVSGSHCNSLLFLSLYSCVYVFYGRCHSVCFGPYIALYSSSGTESHRSVRFGSLVLY